MPPRFVAEPYVPTPKIPAGLCAVNLLNGQQVEIGSAFFERIVDWGVQRGRRPLWCPSAEGWEQLPKPIRAGGWEGCVPRQKTSCDVRHNVDQTAAADLYLSRWWLTDVNDGRVKLRECRFVRLFSFMGPFDRPQEILGPVAESSILLGVEFRTSGMSTPVRYGTTTLDRLRELLSSGRPYTLQQLADELGVTRERVRQLCVKYRLQRLSPHPKHRCSACDKRLRHDNRTGLCRDCLYPRVRLVCSACGKSFQRYAGAHRQWAKRRLTNLTFCSKRCMGRWLGKTYGSGTSRKVARTRQVGY